MRCDQPSRHLRMGQTVYHDNPPYHGLPFLDDVVALLLPQVPGAHQQPDTHNVGATTDISMRRSTKRRPEGGEIMTITDPPPVKGLPLKLSIPTLAIGVLAIVSWMDGGWPSRIATLLALIVCATVDVRSARRHT